MSLGGPEILVIIVIALLVLGPDKLPQAMRTVGKGYAEVKKYQNMAKTEIDKAIAMAEVHETQTMSEKENVSESSKLKEKDLLAPLHSTQDDSHQVKPTLNSAQDDSAQVKPILNSVQHEAGPVKPIIDDED